MHAISSYRGNRPTHTHTNTPTHPPSHKQTDRTDYNTLRKKIKIKITPAESVKVKQAAD